MPTLTAARILASRSLARHRNRSQRMGGNLTADRVHDGHQQSVQISEAFIEVPSRETRPATHRTHAEPGQAVLVQAVRVRRLSEPRVAARPDQPAPHRDRHALRHGAPSRSRVDNRRYQNMVLRRARQAEARMALDSAPEDRRRLGHVGGARHHPRRQRPADRRPHVSGAQGQVLHRSQPLRRVRTGDPDARVRDGRGHGAGSRRRRRGAAEQGPRLRERAGLVVPDRPVLPPRTHAARLRRAPRASPDHAASIHHRPPHHLSRAHE